VKPGDELVTVLRHVSASGMSRDIDVYKFYYDRQNKRVQWLWLSYLAAKATGFRFNEKKEAVTIGGCGMDMGFHLVYSIGRTLFPKGGALKYSPRETQEQRSGKTKETDGGYLVSHRWLG